ncbi:MAG: hypothetical protein WCE90_10540 [Candidatus Zixiibacteriota bacterium]
MKDTTHQNRESDLDPSLRVAALCSDIGRGHPSYLDSVISVLKRTYPDLIYRTVFEEGRGVSLLSWKFLSWLYSISGKGGLQTRFYHLIRKRSETNLADSQLTKILGRDLRRLYRGFPGICLVDHPIVARALAGVCRVWYVHGEIAAPAECAATGAEKTFVPLQGTKEKLISCGADEESIVVCGLMIEPGLADSAETSFEQRLERIRSDQPLTIGFFTSGAYPKEHMEKIVEGARSVIEKRMKAIIFCGTNPQKLEWVKGKARDWRAKLAVDTEGESHENQEFDLMLVTRKTRQEDTQRAIELVPRLDAFVAASHERINWAVGLGLPMFVLFPLIGTFASQNLEFAQKQKVVYPLDSTEKTKDLGAILSELRQSGQILQMAQNGFGVHKIDGIDTAVLRLAIGPAL